MSTEPSNVAMGDEELAKMLQTVRKVETSAALVSKLPEHKSPPLDMIIANLTAHEKNWRDLVAQLEKSVGRSRKDRETTKAERDKALEDRKTTKGELDQARKDRKEAAELLDQAKRGAGAFFQRERELEQREKELNQRLEQQGSSEQRLRQQRKDFEKSSKETSLYLNERLTTLEDKQAELQAGQLALTKEETRLQEGEKKLQEAEKRLKEDNKVAMEALIEKLDKTNLDTAKIPALQEGLQSVATRDTFSNLLQDKLQSVATQGAVAGLDQRLTQQQDAISDLLDRKLTQQQESMQKTMAAELENFPTALLPSFKKPEQPANQLPSPNSRANQLS